MERAQQPSFRTGYSRRAAHRLGGMRLVIETSRLRGRLADALREGETWQHRAHTQAQRFAELESQYAQLAEER